MGWISPVKFLTAKFDSQQALPFISYLSQSSHYPYYNWCDVVHLSTVLGFTILSNTESCVNFPPRRAIHFTKKATQIHSMPSTLKYLSRNISLTCNHHFIFSIYASFHQLYIYVCVYLFLDLRRSLACIPRSIIYIHMSIYSSIRTKVLIDKDTFIQPATTGDGNNPCYYILSNFESSLSLDSSYLDYIL